MATFSFTAYSTASALANSILAGGSTISIIGTPTYTGNTGQVSIYNGLVIDDNNISGMLITTGSGQPAQQNTSSGYTGLYGNYSSSDADIDAMLTNLQAIKPDFSFSGTHDAAALTFDFTVPAGTKAISFDLIFGSEEYPEWANSFVDCAVVMVDGVIMPTSTTIRWHR